MVSNWSVDPFMECNHTAAWDWVYSIQPVYMSVICLLGMVGNTFVLCVFCFQKRHSTVADIYLGNLAAADLLMVSCLPFWVVAVIQEFHWPFGELMCQLVNIVIGMNYYCSVLFLTLVSVDRYLVLARPLSSQGRGRKPAWASGICLVVWVVGALLSLPALLFRSVQFFPHLGVEACYMAYPHDGWRLRYNLTVNIVGFLVPIPVVSFCSYHIIRVLRDKETSRMRSTAAGWKGEEGCPPSTHRPGRIHPLLAALPGGYLPGDPLSLRSHLWLWLGGCIRHQHSTGYLLGLQQQLTEPFPVCVCKKDTYYYL